MVQILRDMIDDLEVHTKVNHNNKARTEPELSKVIEKFEQLVGCYFALVVFHEVALG